MTDEEIFNRRVEKFLKEQPNSNASALINRIITEYPNYKSYFSLFDDFTYRIGMGFLNTAVTNNTNKIIGYVPQFKFYPENLISEKCAVINLVSPNHPMTREGLMKLLSKEVVYKLMRVKNLAELLKLK